jgi:chitin synthase
MDDFSWGNTRVVTGEKGQKIVISDEGKFDPSVIPHKKWEDYQAELWEQQTQRGHEDTRSEVSGYSYGTKSYAPASEYGYGGGMMGMGMPAPPGYQSRPMSQLELPMHGTHSRLSLAPSDMMSQRSGAYGNGGEMEMAMFDLPSDDALLAEIREILRTADLMTVTKKSIKAELENRFGMNLNAKRAYINSGMLSCVLLVKQRLMRLQLRRRSSGVIYRADTRNGRDDHGVTFKKISMWDVGFVGGGRLIGLR